MRGVRKSFQGVHALDGVDLEVHAGEVHALVGENGAGKSTLMKVLSGAHRPDAGQMTLDGEAYAPAGPVDALRRGVAMIYQELNLAPQLTVEENIALGREPRRLGLVDRRTRRARVSAALSRFEHPELRPDRPVSELGPGARQLVEIARALYEGARVVVLDEPTSSLSGPDVEHLFSVVQGLARDGVCVLYISHFLEEVMHLAQRYTVLRDGRSVAQGAIADTNPKLLVEAMVGRSVEEIYPKVPHQLGEVLLQVHSVAGKRVPSCVDLELRRGEILGLAGLVGAGRTETLRILAGLDPFTSGTIVAGAQTLEPQDSPADRKRAGLGLVSEDRKAEGLAVGRSVAENLTLSHLGPLRRGPRGRGPWISLAERRRVTEQWSATLDVRGPGPDAPVGALSGGNQQKICLARLLYQGAEILLLDEPTRGVDVAAKVEIYRQLGEWASEGKALLIVSSYIPELLGICDTIAVMHRGVLGAKRAVEEWTPETLMQCASGGNL